MPICAETARRKASTAVVVAIKVGIGKTMHPRAASRRNGSARVSASGRCSGRFGSPTASSTSSVYCRSRRPASRLPPSRRLRAWTAGCASTPPSPPRSVLRRATCKRKPMLPSWIGISLNISRRTLPHPPSLNRRAMPNTRRRSNGTRSRILKRPCSICCAQRETRAPLQFPVRLALSLPSLVAKAMRTIGRIQLLPIFPPMTLLACLPSFERIRRYRVPRNVSCRQRLVSHPPCPSSTQCYPRFPRCLR
mmetsp:Transcript_10413/g.29278  ORF Transcript_10413/g.29278 Transcript_10413/m.29278 type:complete len:250 (+) Transcript_10413:252-1001(+)